MNNVNVLKVQVQARVNIIVLVMINRVKLSPVLETHAYTRTARSKLREDMIQPMLAFFELGIVGEISKVWYLRATDAFAIVVALR